MEEHYDEEAVLNMELFKTQEIFRERVRAEFLHLMSTDSLFKSEIQRCIQQQMFRYKQSMAQEVSRAFDNLINQS